MYIIVSVYMMTIDLKNILGPPLRSVFSEGPKHYKFYVNPLKTMHPVCPNSIMLFVRQVNLLGPLKG